MVLDVNLNYINERPSSSAADFYELRKIVDEGWQSKASGIGEYEMAMFSAHASKIRSMLGSLEYEITCMPILIKNVKRMDSKERLEYISALESIITGLREEFGETLIVPLVYGIISKSKNLESAKRYLEAVRGIFIERQRRLENALYKNQRSIVRLVAMQRKYESGILRIFMRKKIASIRKRVDFRLKHSMAIEAKISKYKAILGEAGSAHK